MAVQPGETVPRLQPGGVGSLSAASSLPGVVSISDGISIPSINPSVYAFNRQTIQRNIYRIKVP
jgi:hypothetical protein